MSSPAITSSSRNGFAELTIVHVVRDVMTDEGIMPKGSTGVVVAAYDGSDGYEVEFHRPFHTVATLDAVDLAA